jgi:hypothetical protein
VAKNVFHEDIPLSQLPSASTSVRFADQGHVLSKMHVANAIEGSGGFDCHSDGTTKDHVKTVGHQFALDSGETFSLGFTMVSKEDSQTLLDKPEISSKNLQKFMVMRLQNIIETMLEKLVSLMSDRVSVMKAFNKKFDEHRKELLDTEESLQFIHYNAHFLLGLSSEVDKVVKEIFGKEKLGRDACKGFAHFSSSSETCVSRHLRLACSSPLV